MTILTGRIKSICEGTSGLPMSKVHAYRRLMEQRGFELPALPQATVSSGCASGTRGKKKCCGKKKKRRTFRHVLTFAQAALQFVGDGLKTASQEERQRRLDICAACPMEIENRCNLCTCNLPAKAAMRLSYCPAYKWLPVIRDRRPLAVPVRNLAYFVLPINRNDMWQWNLRTLREHWHLFTGSKSLAVSVGSNQSHMKRSIDTDTLADVMEYSRTLGMEWDNVREFPNDPALGEVAAFPWLLENSQKGDVTFYAHAKGVTHHGEPNVQRWTEWMYHALLSDWDTVHNALELYSMCGAFRLYGQFKTPGNNRWHYNGTFYWFRNDDVFSRHWQHIDQKYYGTEAWPGLHFTADECVCLVAEHPGSLYDDSTWNQLQSTLDDWNAARAQ